MTNKKKTTHFDFLSVQAFSKVVGAHPSKVARYASSGLLRPAYKSPKGVRYFAPSQANSFHLIQLLAEHGMPLAKVKELADAHSAEDILTSILEQEREVAAKMQLLRRRYHRLHFYSEHLYESLKAKPGDVSVVELPELHYFEGPPNAKNRRDFYKPFTGFCEEMRKGRAEELVPRIVSGMYENLAAFGEAANPDAFALIDPGGDKCRPAGKYIVGYAQAAFQEKGNLPKRIAAFAKTEKLTPTGPVWTAFLQGDLLAEKHEACLLRACVLVEQTS